MKKWTTREKKLINEAVRMLELASVNEGPIVDGDAAIASMSITELAQQLAQKVKSADLVAVVGFLNAAAKTNTENLKELLNARGSTDSAWGWVEGGESVALSNIIPTQGTIDLMKSVGFMASKDFAIKWEIENPSSPYGDNRNLPLATTKVAGEVYVLDGHHRWSSMHCKKGAAYNADCAVLTIPGAQSAIEGLIKSQIGIAQTAALKTPDKFASEGLPYAKGSDPEEESGTSENSWLKGLLINEGGDDMSTPETETSQASSGETKSGESDTGIPGGGTTTVKEILGEGSIDIEETWATSIGMVNHDSGSVMGNDAWWKALLTTSGGDKAKAFAWLTNFTCDDGAWNEAKSQIQDEMGDSDQITVAPNAGLKTVWNAMGAAFKGNWEGHSSARSNIKREAMPQYAGSKDSYEFPNEVQDTIDVNTSAATVGNYNEPYDDALSESIDLQRWNKLAGILKD